MSELSMAETIAHVLMLGASERRTGQQAEAECDEGSLIKAGRTLGPDSIGVWMIH